MVDQTYLPSKTVTLKEDNLNITNSPSSAPKNIAAAKENYSSLKTVNLSGGTIDEKKTEKPKEELVNNINSKFSPPVNTDSKDSLPSQKIIIKVDGSDSEKKEEKTNEVKSNITTTPISSADTGIRENYSSLKTVNLSGAVTDEKKTEKQKEEQINKFSPPVNTDSKDNLSSQKITIKVDGETSEKKEEKTNEVKSSITPTPISSANISTKENYSSHKTVNLGGAAIDEKKTEKLIEAPVNTTNTTSSSNLSADSKDKYSSQKTTVITEESSAEKKQEKPNEENSEIAYKLSSSSENISSNGNYLSHKTVSLIIEITAEKNIEKPVAPITNIENKNTVSIEDKAKEPVLASVTDSPKQTMKLSEYPEHKSINISKVEPSSIYSAPVKQQVIDKKEESNDNVPPLKASASSEEQISAEKDLEVKPVITPDKKHELVTNEIYTEANQSNYPNNKSYSFVKEENISLSSNAAPDTLVKKSESAVSEKNKPQTVITSVKAKKPILWIGVSAALFVSTAVTGWLAYNQQNSLNGEIAMLKQSKAELTDSIKSLQNDNLRFDDLITRGVKLDPKNNVTVVEAANESNAIRICFSIGSNKFAAKGKKDVYIRFIDSNNNVLLKSKENLFEYRGNQIPYSLKEEVNYKNEEMMLCFDYKPDNALAKGLYKAEIYNNGILDGTETFELK